MVDIFRKQYIVSPVELDLQDMQKHSIGKYYLYTHSLLSAKRFITKAGKQIIVLGNAYCTDAAPKNIEEDISRFDGDNFIELTKYWTGRWALLTEDELVTDACGLMAAFYKDGDDWLISSSLAVIAKLISKPLGDICPPTGISWQLLPDSLLEGVKKLCCTQKLIFSDSKIQAVPYIWPEDFTFLTTEEKSDRISQMLTNACKNIAGSGEKKLLLALTGGKDSRLVLASLLRAEVDFETYTFAYPNLSQADKTLPRRISKNMGFHHNYIKQGKYSSQKAQDYTGFTFGDSNVMDAVFYAHGQFDKLPKNSIIIRSSIFEAGQTYGRTISGETVDSFKRGLLNYYADFFAIERQRQAFDRWFKWAEENSIPFTDIRDRYYIEQRIGGWAAAIEHSLDINDFTSIQIANCPILVSLLLSATEDERKATAISMKCIERLCPNLLKYPINKKTLSDRIHFVFYVLKNPIKRFKNLVNRRLRK